MGVSTEWEKVTEFQGFKLVDALPMIMLGEDKTWYPINTTLIHLVNDLVRACWHQCCWSIRVGSDMPEDKKTIRAMEALGFDFKEVYEYAESKENQRRKDRVDALVAGIVGESQEAEQAALGSYPRGDRGGQSQNVIKLAGTGALGGWPSERLMRIC